MKDFFELLGRVFLVSPDPKKIRAMKLEEGLNVNPVTPKGCIPEKAPMPPTKEPKAKEKIASLELQVRELNDQSARQTELLLKVTQQLSQLNVAIQKISEK